MPASESASSCWRSPSIWIALGIGVAFVLLAVRAVLDPVAASAAFGLPVQSPAETNFVLVYATRNAVLGLLAILFLARRMVSAATLLFALALLLPLADATVVMSRTGAGSELIRHGIALAALATATILLWRRPENAMHVVRSA